MNQRTKILALPRDFFLKLKGLPIEMNVLKEAWAISINSTKGGEETPFSPNALATGKVLVMRFDDIQTEIPGLKLFSTEQARQIREFIENIPKGQTILIHCTAGICRSGAVAEVLDMVLNEDSKEFFKDNPYILPNTHVKSLLLREFGITPLFAKERADKAPYNDFTIGDEE